MLIIVYLKFLVVLFITLYIANFTKAIFILHLLIVILLVVVCFLRLLFSFLR